MTMRLDTYLFEKGLCQSRSRAQNLIKMGQVAVNGNIAEKSSFEVNETDNIEVLCAEFASLGAFKLEKALDDFSYDCNGKICVDIGASNGGFTEVLLSVGASRVYAVDVGECALPERLVNNEKVIVKDRLNARYIKPSDIGEEADLAVIDVSFIPIELVLMPVANLVKKGGNVIALIKPQFECQKKNLTKKGIVKSAKTVENVLKNIKNFCIENALNVIGTTEIPMLFKDKNKEYFINIEV